MMNLIECNEVIIKNLILRSHILLFLQKETQSTEAIITSYGLGVIFLKMAR